LKVYRVGGLNGPADGGDGVAVGGVDGSDTLGRVGTGGAYSFGSSICFAGSSGGGPLISGLRGGCKAGVLQSMVASFVGTEGY
jgi:hypothetical protein